MAGMDYEQLTFGFNGKRLNKNEVKLSTGELIYSYKNRLFLESKNNRIGIHHGEMTLSSPSINIQALRYKNNRMVWMIHHTTYIDKIYKDYVACGIAVYGHINTMKYYVEKAGYNYNPDHMWCTSYCGDKTYLERYRPQYIKINHPKSKEIESWVGITQYDLKKLFYLLRINNQLDHLKLVQSNFPLDLPQTDIVAHLDEVPSLFNMMWGTKKKLPKNFQYTKYLGA